MNTHAAAHPKQTSTLAFQPAPGFLLQRKCACGGSAGAASECEECARRKDTLQRKAANDRTVDEIPPIVHEVLRSSGQPLDAATRAFMEPRFGHDFGNVRVHTDAIAGRSARAVNALAYTAGRHVVVDPNYYAPSSRDGRRLLAHELTHVVQQENLRPELSARAVGSRNESHEIEADSVAARVVDAGLPTGTVSANGSVTLARYAPPPIPITPEQINIMRALFSEIGALTRSGVLLAEETAAISTAVAEAEAAIVVATEAAAAGTTALAVGESALGGAAALAVDDVTGIGVADDVAIPFVLIAAAVAFGVGYAVGRSAGEIAAAWDAATRAVGAAVGAMRDALARARPGPRVKTEPRAEPKVKPETKPDPKTAPRPLPWPDIDTDENDRRCRSYAVGQRGGNTCHDAFATLVSGMPREWGVETPEGLYADFDGLGAGRMLYEIKTGYGFLLNASPSTQLMREQTIHRFIEQSTNQLRVARRCGYGLVWVFNNRAVADLVNGFIEPPVSSRPFDCNEDA